MAVAYEVDDGARAANALAFRAMRAAGVFWLVVAIGGQWLFVYYIVAFFGAPTLQGDFAAWNRNTFLFHGYVAGDSVGNLALAAHVMMAAVITFGGTLQLIPQIRSHAAWLHRWNGRLFVLVAFAISLAGLFLNATRGTHWFNAIAISLNAGLIMYGAAQAFGYARAGDIDTHRRWALRTFLVMNGVWFLRVGFSAWIVTTQGIVSAPTFDPVFYMFWSFGSYLVPLAVFELYLRTERSAGAAGRFVVAVLLFGLAAVMAVGIFGAYMIF